MRGIDLHFTDEALEAAAQLAMDRNTGARGLRSVLERALLDPMFEVPDMPDVNAVYVDATAVRGEGPARILSGSETLESFLAQGQDVAEEDELEEAAL